MTDEPSDFEPEGEVGHQAWAEVEGIPEVRLVDLGVETFDFNKNLRPHQFTWMDKGVLSPVTDQRPYQTCVAQSACHCLEARRKIAGTPIPDLDPEMFHRCVRGLTFAQGEDKIDETLNRLYNTGAPIAGSGFSPGARCSDFHPTFVRATGYGQMSTPQKVKEIVSTYSPVISLMTAEPRLAQVNDFSVFRDGAGAKTFLHAMLLVGYDDINQCWIVQNTFGPGWGQQGFGRIAYGSASVLSNSRHRCYLAG